MAGESFLQLVVPKARRKHVLNLCHDVFGGRMAVKRTKEGIEFTFYWPTLHDVVKFGWHHSIARPRTSPVEHKDLRVISYASRLIADLAPNFVAMAMGVGRGN